ncbi:MAG: transporter substrate-binding domain-containing protein [bacterium]|nr:transporter substrate-binding domain-containing protein [bacterium]
MMKMYRTFFVIMFVLVMVSSADGIELKTVYQENSFPKYVLDRSETLADATGICVEILAALERDVPDLTFSAIKASPFKRVLHELEKGGIDFFCGMARNEERENKYIYLDTPVYKVSYIVAVRADDKISVENFDDIRKLAPDNVILTNAGTAAERFLKEQGGLSIDARGKDIPQNLKKLQAKRGRFYLFHDLGLASTLKKDFQGQNLKVLPASFREYHHYAVFAKQSDPEVVDHVGAALKELAERGKLKAIFEKYVSME